MGGMIEGMDWRFWLSLAMLGVVVGMPMLAYNETGDGLVCVGLGVFGYLFSGFVVCIICERFSVRLALLWFPALWIERINRLLP